MSNPMSSEPKTEHNEQGLLQQAAEKLGDAVATIDQTVTTGLRNATHAVAETVSTASANVDEKAGKPAHQQRSVPGNVDTL